MTEHPCRARNGRCRCGRRGEHTVHACYGPSAVTVSGRCRGKWLGGTNLYTDPPQDPPLQYPTGARTEAEAWKHRRQLLDHLGAKIHDRKVR